MKISLIVLCLVALMLLVMPVSANAFSAWGAAGTCWTATNDTYTLRMWNTTGIDTWTIPTGVTSTNYLVVAGAGSGSAGANGAYRGGGGGAGQVLQGTLAVTAGNTYTVTVGQGGAETTGSTGNDGSNSSFSTIQANKGSGGAGNNGAASGSGKTGGAGDGSYGGGGAGDAANGGASAGDGGTGGTGIPSAITGTSITYGYGGGGGAGVTPKAGSPDGGGYGSATGGSIQATAGTVNRGGGGGGGYTGIPANGKAGGSGVVIISYQTPVAAPIVQFTITNTSGTVPYLTNLTDTSLNTPTGWNWTAYNTGNSTEFILASTQYRTQWFPEVGNYSIQLNVSNAAGYNKSTLYQSGHWVNVSAAAPSVLPPIVSWSVSPVTLIFPGRVTFNETFIRDGVHDPTAWNYTPGDGNVNVSLGLRNVSYQYYKRGLWNATLNVSNSAGYNITYQWIRVIGYQG